MTSKHSLWTRWVQQNKRYIWLYVINSILLLFLGPVQLSYSFSEWGNDYWPDEAQHFFGFHLKICFVFIALAIFTGIFIFSYLHSQKKIDFYHSQPMSEKNRFFNLYTSGLLCNYIPYIITFLLNIIIAKCFGVLTFDLFQHALATLMIYMLAYFAAYQIAVLMTIITGNVLYSLGLTLIAFVYEIFLRKIIIDFSSIFFHNFADYPFRDSLNCKWSAVWALLQKTEALSCTASSKEMWQATGGTCIRVAILSVITGAIAYLVYKKRPSEYFGPSLVFHKLKPIVKICITILATLFTVDFYFDYIATTYYYEYIVTSTKVTIITPILMLFVICVCHILCEFLWELDFRAIKNNLLPTLIAGGFTFLLFYSFYFDWFGYDTYVPDAKDVESVSVRFDHFYDNAKTCNYYESLKLTCVEAACNTAKELCNNNTHFGMDLLDTQTSQDTTFIFHMKDGTTCYRNYEVIIENGKTPIKKLLNNEEYKKATNPFIYDDNYTEKIETETESYLFWRDKSNYIEALEAQNKEQIKKLQQALQADIKDHPELTPFTLANDHTAIGLLTAKYPVANTNSTKKNKVYKTNYLIFSEYTRTLECLKEMGITTDITTGFPLQDISSLKIYTYNNKEDKKTITDTKQIKDILSLTGNDWQLCNDNAENNHYEIDIYFHNTKRVSASFNGYEIPTWITDLF